MLKRAFAVFFGLSSAVLTASCGSAPDQSSSLVAAPGAETQDVEGNQTLMFVPQGANVGTDALETSATPTVRVFYPKAGQSRDGLCWEGLASDSAGNIYPIANAGVYKLDRNARTVNGQNDRNFFGNENLSSFIAIDEAVHRMFSASLSTVHSAPFETGALFTDLISGIRTQGTAVAIGKGPRDGSFFVTDVAASRIYRVTLQPLALRLFASGALYKAPESIASALDGTLYVVNVGSVIEPAGRSIIKIAPDGTASTFATSANTTARRMLAVDTAGIVYWSKEHGIDRFRPDGTRLVALPGPSDQPAFENPMGAAFDPQGNLYVVENFGCKKIYKYNLGS